MQLRRTVCWIEEFHKPMFAWCSVVAAAERERNWNLKAGHVLWGHTYIKVIVTRYKNRDVPPCPTLQHYYPEKPLLDQPHAVPNARQIKRRPDISWDSVCDDFALTRFILMQCDRSDPGNNTTCRGCIRMGLTCTRRCWMWLAAFVWDGRVLM